MVTNFLLQRHRDNERAVGMQARKPEKTKVRETERVRNHERVKVEEGGVREYEKANVGEPKECDSMRE